LIILHLVSTFVRAGRFHPSRLAINAGVSAQAHVQFKKVIASVATSASSTSPSATEEEQNKAQAE
jgi:hypothetical protein